MALFFGSFRRSPLKTSRPEMFWARNFAAFICASLHACPPDKERGKMYECSSAYSDPCQQRIEQRLCGRARGPVVWCIWGSLTPTSAPLGRPIPWFQRPPLAQRCASECRSGPPNLSQRNLIVRSLLCPAGGLLRPITKGRVAGEIGTDPFIAPPVERALSK